MIQIRFLSVLALVALAAACGGGGGGGGTSTVPGGGGGSLATPTPTPNALASGTAVAAFKISLPRGTYAASATRRTGQAIGTGTQSIVFTLLQQNGTPTTGSPQAFGLTASSQGCIINTTTQALTCTLSVDAPIGQDVFLAQTFDGTGGTGNLTGSGAVALSVGLNSTNTASIVLNAQVASVTLVAANAFLGTTSNTTAKVRQSLGIRRMAGIRLPQQAIGPVTVNSTPIYVVAVDSSGNTILNPSAYSAPIYLQLAFDNEGDPYVTADVTLSVQYSANDPSPCTPGQSASTAVWYGSLPVCSPSDQIVASLSANGGPDPSDFAVVFGWTSPSQLIPTPAPSSSPIPLPSPPAANSYAFMYVIFPQASPTPSAQLPIQVQ